MEDEGVRSTIIQAEKVSRTNFSRDEDLMIMRQALAEEPYAEFGKVADGWMQVAAVLSDCPLFPRNEVKAKSLQKRWATIRKKHEKQNFLVVYHFILFYF